MGCSSLNRRWLRRRMEKRATATYCLQSAQFKLHSSRTMTGRCRSWPKTPQDETMLISLKTLVERTAKRQSQPVTPVLAVCAAFAAQPSVYPPEARRPDVAPLYGSVAEMANAEEERLRADFSRGRSRKRRNRTNRIYNIMNESLRDCFHRPCGYSTKAFSVVGAAFCYSPFLRYVETARMCNLERFALRKESKKC